MSPRLTATWDKLDPPEITDSYVAQKNPGMCV